MHFKFTNINKDLFQVFWGFVLILGGNEADGLFIFTVQISWNLNILCNIEFQKTFVPDIYAKLGIWNFFE